MTGEDLPGEDHVVRYVKPSQVLAAGAVDGVAFRRRPGEIAPSVNWLEAFPGGKNSQLAMVRRLTRMTLRRAGRFAELQVDGVIHDLRQHIELRVLHRPLEAEGEFEADPSHSEMAGLPPGDSDEAALVGDMIAECVIGLHAAVAEPQAASAP